LIALRAEICGAGRRIGDGGDRPLEHLVQK
jgi:hypothetical protein